MISRPACDLGRVGGWDCFEAELSFLGFSCSPLTFKSFGGYLKVQWSAALFLKCECRIVDVLDWHCGFLAVRGQLGSVQKVLNIAFRKLDSQAS